MQKQLFVLALQGLALLALCAPGSANGGLSPRPFDPAPAGGGGTGPGSGPAGPGTGPAGPTTPGPTGPTTPGGGAPGVPGLNPGGASVTATGADQGSDLTLWSFWWERNKAPYLNLKAKIHNAGPRTGVEGIFLGQAKTAGSEVGLQPTREQIRQRIVPARLAALEKETNNDIVTGCMIALAKIGDAPDETGESRFEPVIARFLADRNQEISETAAVALGILANPRSIATLEHLLRDTKHGRELVGQSEVHYRTRAFAAYGLGLVGATASREEDRRSVVQILREALENDDTRTRDLKASCVISMGLVKLDTMESSREAEKGALLPPESSRSAQLDYLLALLVDEEQNHLVRAHSPTALARLLDGLPSAMHASYREKVGNALLERIAAKKEQAEVVQSAVLALGLVGTNDGTDPLDKRIREVLLALPKDVKDAQARNFAMIALAKVGGAAGRADAQSGIQDSSDALLAQLTGGNGAVRPWAGLACGVIADLLSRSPTNAARIGSLQLGVRSALDDEKDPAKLGAVAIAAGIMADVEAKPMLLERLRSERDDTARGYVALGLGLMNAHEAVEKINAIVDDSKYRPLLLNQAAIALGLIGDKDLVPKLAGLLVESKGLATQASLSEALGLIGDHRAVDPLVKMLENEDLMPRARGFAAAALGIVADKEPLPWNSKISLDLNYRAATQTLTDQVAGTGILDIL